ncbi:MAG: pilin [Patescibacteria group bacterium]
MQFACRLKNPPAPPPAAPSPTPPASYNLLEELPCDSANTPGCVGGKLTDIQLSGNDALGKYLNTIIRLAIGIAAVLAVVMIVMGGIQYMTTELTHSKEAGKERIRNAILGLLVALGAYLILNTINPKLLSTELVIDPVSIDYVYGNSAVVKSSGVASCSVATSGACAPSNMAIFGDQADDASRICMVESGGIANAPSRTDRCGDDKAFSYGLFQINLIANGNLVRDQSGRTCTGLFEMADGSPIVGSKYIAKKSDGSFDYYDCRAKTSEIPRLSQCAVSLMNAQTNISVAKALYNRSSRPFGAWYYSDRRACGEAPFQ